MNLENQLLEVELGTSNPQINNLFNAALKQVFNRQYLAKIENVIDKKIKIKEVHDRNPNVIAYSIGSTIYINKKEFYRLPLINQIKYVLHEFIHVMQNNKRFFIIRGLKELHELTNRLNDAVQGNLLKPYSVFLTKKNTKIGEGGKYEILAYIMNNSIDWDALSTEGRKKFLQALEDSNILNLESPFWKSRINNI
jgi:hypothetical protein